MRRFKTLDLILVVPLGVLCGWLLPTVLFEWSPAEAEVVASPGLDEPEGGTAPPPAVTALPTQHAETEVPPPVPPLPELPHIADFAAPSLEEIEAINEYVDLLAKHYPDELIAFARSHPELCQYVRLVDAVDMVELLARRDLDLTVAMLEERRFYVDEAQLLKGVFARVGEDRLGRARELYDRLAETELAPLAVLPMAWVYYGRGDHVGGLRFMATADEAARAAPGFVPRDSRSEMGALRIRAFFEGFRMIDTPQEHAEMARVFSTLKDGRLIAKYAKSYIGNVKNVDVDLLLNAVETAEPDVRWGIMQDLASPYSAQMLALIEREPETLENLSRNRRTNLLGQLASSPKREVIVRMAELGYLDELDDRALKGSARSLAEWDLESALDLFLEIRPHLENTTSFEDGLLEVAERFGAESEIERRRK